MPFSNVWDTTFPPDTQLANLLGQDIRNGVKVDVQQRMAAISGLDAAKPAFSGDAQPANWNGILFFATDTSKIYQWNNPTWVDVTSSIRPSSGAFFKNAVIQSHTGTTSLDILYTVPLPAMSIGNIFRVKLGVRFQTQGAGTSKLFYNLNATSQQFSDSSLGVNQYIEFILNVVSAVSIHVSFGINNDSVSSASIDGGLAVANLNAQNFLIQIQSANNSDLQRGGFITAESM